MRKNYKKFTTVILLAAFILFITLVSCQSGDNASNNQNSGNDGNDVQVEEQAEVQETETTTERLYPDLEAKDYGGYEFVFLGRIIINPDWVEWEHRDLTAEEINGDVINDAVFVRNRKIEEKYNIIISEFIDTDAVGKLTKSIKSGDDNYDVFCPHFREIPNIAQNGYLTDLFKTPNIDLAKPWWDQGSIRDLSIINKLFVVQGDLMILDNDALEAMIFNKTLLRDYALESPYDIVKRGEWTFEKLIEMSRGVSKDLNGDGLMFIKEDQFGCILQRDTAPSFIVSGGEKLVGKDENDYPVIMFGSERSYKIIDALNELFLDENNVVHLHRYEGKFPIYDEQVKMFQENRGLFSWIRMRIVERLRGMEMDFGIIPCPKLDKVQENYYSQNNPHTGAGIAIPVSASDLERTGAILEDLCAESKYTLQPAYYEINLRGKYARDDESQEMLDIILSNTAHDLGHVYNFGAFADVILNYGQTFKTDYASAFDKAVTKMEKDIEKMITAYENVG